MLVELGRKKKSQHVYQLSLNLDTYEVKTFDYWHLKKKLTHEQLFLEMLVLYNKIHGEQGKK